VPVASTEGGEQPGENDDPDNDEYGPPLVSLPVPKTTEGDDIVA
jgi:hypothetical protein